MSENKLPNNNNNHNSQRDGNSRRKPGSRCRRNLFGGPCDNAELEREVKLMEQQERDRFIQRWNFDIETEAPCPGSFEWTKVGGPSSTTSGSGLLSTPALDIAECSRSDNPGAASATQDSVESFPSSCLSSVTASQKSDDDIEMANENDSTLLRSPNRFRDSTKRKRLNDDNDTDRHGSSKNGKPSSTGKPPRA